MAWPALAPPGECSLSPSSKSRDAQRYFLLSLGDAKRSTDASVSDVVTEEIPMATMLKNAQQRAAMTAKEERARDAALARREYDANQLAVRTKTARLRALRSGKRSREQAIHEHERGGERRSQIFTAWRHKRPSATRRSCNTNIIMIGFLSFLRCGRSEFARDRRRGDRVAARGMAASAHGERKTR